MEVVGGAHKRRRIDQASEPAKVANHSVTDDDDESEVIPSDVVAAIQLLTSEFRQHQLTGQHASAVRKQQQRPMRPQHQLPLVLKSQLYTVLKDRTVVDRDLDDLRLRGLVRVLKLPTGTSSDTPNQQHLAQM